jgi:hypothetical protein
MTTERQPWTSRDQDRLTVDAVAPLERMASGHINYVSKAALYVAELVIGVRP